ncbi:hypothetical protein [Labrys neptuniae]
MSGFFPRGGMITRDFIAKRADMGDGSGGGYSSRGPCTLTRQAGQVAYILDRDHEKKKAAIYKRVYQKDLPYAVYAVAHVVARLEDNGQHPKIDIVRKEIASFLNTSHEYACTALNTALAHDIVSRYEGDGKETVFLKEGDQRRKLLEVERLRIELHEETHRQLTNALAENRPTFLDRPEIYGPDK